VHLPIAEQMHMQMIDFLSAVAITINHGAIAGVGNAFLLGYFCHHLQ
jgi:hypothetical protein